MRARPGGDPQTDPTFGDLPPPDEWRGQCPDQVQTRQAGKPRNWPTARRKHDDARKGEDGGERSRQDACGKQHRRGYITLNIWHAITMLVRFARCQQELTGVPSSTDIHRFAARSRASNQPRPPRFVAAHIPLDLPRRRRSPYPQRSSRETAHKGLNRLMPRHCKSAEQAGVTFRALIAGGALRWCRAADKRTLRVRS